MKIIIDGSFDITPYAALVGFSIHDGNPETINIDDIYCCLVDAGKEITNIEYDPQTGEGRLVDLGFLQAGQEFQINKEEVAQSWIDHRECENCGRGIASDPAYKGPMHCIFCKGLMSSKG